MKVTEGGSQDFDHVWSIPFNVFAASLQLQPQTIPFGWLISITL